MDSSMPFTTFKTRESQPRVLVGQVLGDTIKPLAGVAGLSMKALLSQGQGNLDQFNEYTDERFAFSDAIHCTRNRAVNIN